MSPSPSSSILKIAVELQLSTMHVRTRRQSQPRGRVHSARQAFGAVFAACQCRPTGLLAVLELCIGASVRHEHSLDRWPLGSRKNSAPSRPNVDLRHANVVRVCPLFVSWWRFPLVFWRTGVLQETGDATGYAVRTIRERGETGRCPPALGGVRRCRSARHGKRSVF